MLKSWESHLVDAIGSSFNEMDEAYARIRQHSAELASLRRQESGVGRHCATFEMLMSNDYQLGSYVDVGVLGRVRLSFSTSAAQGLEKVFDLLNLLRALALKIFSSFELLINTLREDIVKKSCHLSALNSIVESLMEMVESMVDEIDLVSQWVISNPLSDPIAAHITPPFEFVSSCLSDQMLCGTFWREEVCPLLKFAVLKCSQLSFQ